jgi:hypothetical protein
MERKRDSFGGTYRYKGKGKQNVVQRYYSGKKSEQNKQIGNRLPTQTRQKLVSENMRMKWLEMYNRTPKPSFLVICVSSHPCHLCECPLLLVPKSMIQRDAAEQKFAMTAFRM